MANKTVMDDLQSLRKIERWKTSDGILHAKNYLFRLAYVVTDDPQTLASRLGTVNGMVIEWITAEQAKLWDGCECRQS